MRKLSFVFSVMLLAALAGCSGKFSSEEFLREDVDLGAISRIAVLPFQNFTNEQYAAERVRNVAITQLLSRGVADVVDRGVVDSVLAEEVIDPRLPIDLINLKRLGQRLNVQAFMLGSVDKVDSIRRGSVSYPVLGVTLRMVDAQAGVVFWQSSGRWSAETKTARIFGSEPTDDFHVTLELMSRMLKNLSRK